MAFSTVWWLVTGGLIAVELLTGTFYLLMLSLGAAAAALAALPEVIDETLWPVWTTAVKDATGAKGKALFMPLRMMITGQSHGPDMATLAPMIGRERIVKRLKGETA